MPAQSANWTAELVRSLPDDGNRYEVIDGELFVTPSPTWEHQRAAFEIALHLRLYARKHSIGDVIVAPADVEFRFDRMVEPDVFVVPLVGGRRPRTWEEAGRLLLAVEVLSPSTARADRQAKRMLYQSENVPEYWIVDVAARLVERWRPDDVRPEIIVGALVWAPAAATAPLTLDLDGYFREVCVEERALGNPAPE